ncbi:MAG: membrane protein YqaA with SNARE-associated domain [Candidatus Paceibacteria bacterium]|jgi:membrane protein YqaA with SNARE-associated domain
MDKIKHKFKESVLRFAESPHSTAWLFFLSFVEASIFPVPPDLLLVAILSTGEHRRWVFYSFVTTISSVFGGILGYAIGYSFFGIIGEQMIALYGLEAQFLQIGELLGKNAFLTIFVSGFTPVPYKIFTIASGFFEINLIVFITASVIGRGARFFLVSFIMNKFGEKFGDGLHKKINIISIVVGLVIVGIALLII